VSVWVLRQSLTAEQEQQIAQQPVLMLPFKGLPDLSGTQSEGALQAMMRQLQPDTPFETIHRQAEIHWRNLSQLRIEDLIIVPLPHNKSAALAQVSDRYRYGVSHAGEDMHQVGVQWLQPVIPLRKVPALAKLFASPILMQPVEHAEQRAQVYALLKRPYNRFIKLRWIMGIVITVQLVAMLVQMLKS